VVIPESRDEKLRFKADPLGIILSASSLFLLTFGLINGAKHYGLLYKKEAFAIGHFTLDLGKRSPTPLILALALVLGAIFLRRETRKEDPLLEAGLFRDPNFTGGSFVTAALQFAMMGAFFLMPFFHKTVIGLDSFKAGLAMIPMAIAVMIVSPIAGMAVMAGALLFIANLSPSTTLASLVLPFALLGVGIGLPMSPTTSAALLDVPVGKVGGASGTLYMLRQVGAILDIALPGAMERRVAAMSAPEPRLEKKVARVKAMMPSGMAGSSASMGSTDISAYKDKLAVFFPDPADANAVAKGLTSAVMTGMSDGMNEAFRWAALAPLLGALGAAFLMKNGKRGRAEQAENDPDAAVTAEVEA
jgi:hypothetical protein